MSEQEGEVWMDVDYVIPRTPKSTRTLRAFTDEQLRAHDDRIRAEALAPVLALADEWDEAKRPGMVGISKAIRAAAGTPTHHTTEEERKG